MSPRAAEFKMPENIANEPPRRNGFWISTADYRPCIVDDMRATFHRWEDKSWIVPPSPMVGGHAGGVVRGTYAIVEMPDGTVREVEPGDVRFLTTSELFERRCMGKWVSRDG